MSKKHSRVSTTGPISMKNLIEYDKEDGKTCSYEQKAETDICGGFKIHWERVATWGPMTAFGRNQEGNAPDLAGGLHVCRILSF
jgi:hypothetical protein